MSGAAANWTAYWRESAFLRCAFWLTCAVGLLLALLLPIAFWNGGAVEALEVTVAAVICLLPGLIALGITSYNTNSQQVFSAFLLSMGVRMSPPLVICLALSFQSTPALRSTGAEYFSFICYLLLFYMVTLALETYLSVRLIQPKRKVCT